MEIKPRLTEHGTLNPSKMADTEIVAGLLAKRSKMFNEAEQLRDRMAVIKNDVAALDRVLSTLGYTGDLDSIMPRQKVNRLFGAGELLRACLLEIRHADGPMTSREIARNIVELRGDDPNDRKYLSDMTRRISKCLRKEREAGHVIARQHSGRALVWRLA